jgi:hypothetical protein
MRSGEPFLPGFPATRQELFAFDLLIPATSTLRH